MVLNLLLEKMDQKFEELTFESTFNKEKLNSIYSNLDTLSFYKIMTEIDELVKEAIIINFWKRRNTTIYHCHFF